MEETKMSCDSEGKELVLVQILGIQKSDLYVVDLEARKVWRKPIATLFNYVFDQHIVRLGSVIYNVRGPARPYPDINLKLKDDSQYIYNGVSCLELSKSNLLSLLKGGDAALCEDDDLDSPFKSRPGPGPWSGFGLVPIWWKVAPTTCCERRFSCCASLGGKIYALGGSAETSIGEVFTPECGEWSLLPPPPADVTVERHCVSSPVLADEKNERLIVHFRKAYVLYAYYPAAKRWDCVAPKLNRHKHTLRESVRPCFE